MKILWANTNLLHPTTKGGQIRTLEMLRILRRCHEIHYVTFSDPRNPAPLRSSGEYSAYVHSVPRRSVSKTSLAFCGEVVRGIFSPEPVATERHRSGKMSSLISRLLARERFDRVVCDHLAPASHFADLSRCLLFQHNVETAIWRRRAEQASDPVRRWYLRGQAERMSTFESRVSRAAGHVVAVSPADAELMRQWFGVSRISEIPTGVNLEFFAAPASSPAVADLVFVGSMDWSPNIHGIRFFLTDVLPIIRRRRPHCSLAIVGRMPPADIRGWARRDSRILVTGTVPDVRPYLWGSAVSIVPLYIGGGTRLKIYESMAARVPVVSTSVGAEGLDVRPPDNIRIADTAEAFAEECLTLLENATERDRLASAACDMVSSRYSWATVAKRFEEILERAPCLGAGVG
jgi:glycosyltransferase involved in cell wall biosynthesis